MVIILCCYGNNDKNRNWNIFNMDAVFAITAGTQDLVYAGSALYQTRDVIFPQIFMVHGL